KYLEYASPEEFVPILQALPRPFLHIGGGSNLLFASDRFSGTVFHCINKNLEIISENEDFLDVKVGAGYVWDDFVEYCVNHGWYGAENLTLIPGEVGAAAVQNIGAYGVEAKDIILSVDTFDIESLSVRIFKNEECRYAYRESIFKKEENKRYFVQSVTFRLSKKPNYKLEYGNLKKALSSTPTLSEIRAALIDIRNSKLPDPAKIPSAGSFFTNPMVEKEKAASLLTIYPTMPQYPVNENIVKLSAGWMIEQCGWKGVKMGNAAVYERQALVLVNCGEASGRDILSLANKIVDSVQDKFGVTLTMEVQVI
ncbi:MAG: UDP-N-acetylmuramate dehydrogenase, partial [Bacteroidales bacterium]|nr:UDP-N-acetylmuramate dehydrogenase [Bacteroidales bacterium]